MSGSILDALAAANRDLFPADRLTGPSPLHVTVDPDAVTPGEWWDRHPEKWTYRRHVSRSQVWAGSRGGVTRRVHVHTPTSGDVLVLRSWKGRRSTIERRPGAALCGKDAGWYEADVSPTDLTSREDLCPRCAEIVDRYDVTLPTPPWGTCEYGDHLNDATVWEDGLSRGISGMIIVCQTHGTHAPPAVYENWWAPCGE